MVYALCTGFFPSLWRLTGASPSYLHVHNKSGSRQLSPQGTNQCKKCKETYEVVKENFMIIQSLWMDIIVMTMMMMHVVVLCFVV
jgi:hypothetical protein